MPPIHSLHVTKATSLSELTTFLAGVKDEKHLHAKIQKDGSRLLYVSKGKGTGLKEALFPETFATRKMSARLAILQITKAIKEYDGGDVMHASMKNGLMKRGAEEIDKSSPLVAGSLKTGLSTAIRTGGKPLANKYFRSIELDLADGEVKTAFSTRNHFGLDAIDQLAKSDPEEISEKFSSFIAENFDRCPFDISTAHEQIHHFCSNLHRSTDEAEQIFVELLQGKMTDDDLKSRAARLSENMAADIKKLNFCAELFRSKEFSIHFTPGQRKLLDQLGGQLGELSERFEEPEGAYQSLSRILAVGINAPADLKFYLNDYRSGFTLANLPDGVTVDENGHLSGSQVIHQVPDYSRYSKELLVQARQYAGKSIEEMLQDVKEGSLQRGVDVVGDITIAKQASADFWRFNYEIPTAPDTVFKSSDLPAGNDRQKERNLSVANAVHRFTDDNSNATFVLSSILNQTTISSLFHCVTDPWGGAVPFRIISTGNATTFGGPLKIQTADGGEEKISAQSMGASQWKLSHEVAADGGVDYKISIDWQTYGVANEEQQTWLSLPDNNVIGVHFSMDIIVDGEAARNGNLKLSIPDGVRATFSGRVNVQRGDAGGPEEQQAQ